MADLFDDSLSEPEADTKPAQTNGIGELDEPSSPQLGVTSLGSLAFSEDLAEEEEEEGEGARRGSRDDIKVTVTGFQKTAEDHSFEVEVEVNGKRSTLHRTYKELLWLHRNLTRRVELGGNILPPMPPPPAKTTDVKVVLIGENSRGLYGDHSRLYCLGVEMFLQSLADHRFFSENNTVHTYLVKEQVEEEERLGTGSLWSVFTKTISDIQKGGVQDPEEEFTKFLKNIEDLSPKLQETAKAFSNMISAQQSMAVSEYLLSEMLWEHSNWSREKNSCANSFDKLASGVQEEKEYLIATAYDGRHTLGFTLDLYVAYCTQAKEMLFRRLGKLQTLIACNSTLDKAKPDKKAAAQTAKEEADRAFKAISETAKREIKDYSAQYSSAFRENLTSYAQAQIHHSKQTHRNLTNLRDELARTLLD